MIALFIAVLGGWILVTICDFLASLGVPRSWLA